MIVASYFQLINKDQNQFNIWLKTLPLYLKDGEKEVLWSKTKNKTQVAWTKYKGFIVS